MSEMLYPDVGPSLLPVPMTEEEAQTLEVPLIHVSHLEPPETVLRDLSGVRVILNCACFLLDQNVALFFTYYASVCISCASATATVLETSVAFAARELKRRYDQRCNVGKDGLRSPYSVTTLTAQTGGTVHRVRYGFLWHLGIPLIPLQPVLATVLRELYISITCHYRNSRTMLFWNTIWLNRILPSGRLPLDFDLLFLDSHVIGEDRVSVSQRLHLQHLFHLSLLRALRVEYRFQLPLLMLTILLPIHLMQYLDTHVPPTPSQRSINLLGHRPKLSDIRLEEL